MFFYQNQEFYTIYDLMDMNPEELNKLGLLRRLTNINTASNNELHH
jgi:hypothetical protein